MKVLDLTLILKNIPKGFKLFSPIFGDVEFLEILKDDNFPIVVKYGDIRQFFSKEGKFFINEDSECLLFPSKENRDWSTFKVSNNQKFDINTLKPFDKVLVRNDGYAWKCDIFSYIIDNSNIKFVCIGSSFNQCIPYNDDTEYLVGTHMIPPQFYDIF